MTRADRKNQGKPKLSMIDLSCMTACAEVLEFGATKYTVNLEVNWENKEQICRYLTNVSHAVKIEKLNLEECVRAVTTNIQNLSVNVHYAEELDKYGQSLSVNHVMKKTGSAKIHPPKKELENIKKNIDQTPSLRKEKESEIGRGDYSKDIQKERNDQNFLEDYLNTGFLNSSIHKLSKKDVKFVSPQLDHTLTTITLLDNSEVSFVVSAITLSDCLMIILKSLIVLLNISKKFKIDQGILQIDGKNNWKKGMPLTELLDSLLRHIAKLQSGEWVDEESGIAHIGHIQCNAMFLGNPNNTLDIEIKEE